MTTPEERGEALGAARHLEWAPIPTEWSGGRGAARPLEWRKTPLPRGCHFTNPGGLPFPRRDVFAPHGGSVSPPRWPSRGWLSRRRSRRPLHPPVARLHRFLGCPVATLSAGRVPPRPPLTPRPMWRRYYRSSRSIHRCCPPPRLLSPPPPHGPADACPHPRAPAPGPGRQYRPKERRCRQSDGRGCCTLVVGGLIRAPWKMA